MKHQTAELTPMTRKVSKSMTAYLTPEQVASAGVPCQVHRRISGDLPFEVNPELVSFERVV